MKKNILVLLVSVVLSACSSKPKTACDSLLRQREYCLTTLKHLCINGHGGQDLFISQISEIDSLIDKKCLDKK